MPIGFKGMVADADLPEVRRQLIPVLEHIEALRAVSGKEIVLALEPEPGCLLETTEEVCRFFEVMAFPAELRDWRTPAFASPRSRYPRR